MDITTILVALGLAMDSFSVSIAEGLTNKAFKTSRALRISFCFGLVQGIMPVIGWLAGVHLLTLISDFDHWIAFGLLILIGCRMIYESARTESERLVTSSNIRVLLVLAIATSIDALAVGLSLSFLQVSIITPALVTGIVTFLLSFFGVYIGDRFGHFLGKKIEILGGIILITIGTKILVEHLLAI